jgi:hypothetical protein
VPARLRDDIQTADVFEDQVARPGVERWTQDRFTKVARDGVLSKAPDAFRQLFTTTTINLVSSQQQSATAKAGGKLDVPREIFFNQDLLVPLLQTGDAALPPSLTTNPTVLGEHYLAAVQECGVSLVGQGPNGQSVTIPGDSFFALITPEAAFEDIAVAQRLVQIDVVTARLVCCVAMVDYPNPIFSPRRASLLAAVPPDLRFTDGPEKASQDLADAIARLSGPGRDAFVENWVQDSNAFRKHFIDVLDDYMTKVVARLAQPEGVVDLMRLVTSRRRQFQHMDLSEFSLTVPVGNTPKDPLCMAEDGTVLLQSTRS